MPSSSSMYRPSYSPPHHDETIIPILCTSDRYHTAAPVRMRIRMKTSSPSVSIPRPLQVERSPPPPMHPPPDYELCSELPTRLALYDSPMRSPQHLYFDPARAEPSYWRTMLPTQFYRRSRKDGRLLSQRLWDIDSGDDEETSLATEKVSTPMQKPSYTIRANPLAHADQIMLHIDDSDEDSYRQQHVHVWDEKTRKWFVIDASLELFSQVRAEQSAQNELYSVLLFFMNSAISVFVLYFSFDLHFNALARSCIWIRNAHAWREDCSFSVEMMQRINGLLSRMSFIHQPKENLQGSTGWNIEEELIRHSSSSSLPTYMQVA